VAAATTRATSRRGSPVERCANGAVVVVLRVRQHRPMLRVLAAAALVAACSHAPRAPGDAAERAPRPAPGAVLLPSAASGPLDHTSWKLPAGAQRGERERCIDGALRALHLNDYGDPEGTTYADGRPVGVSASSDRYAYVMRRRPDIAVDCSHAAGEPDR
jgi:hypothetical protein